MLRHCTLVLLMMAALVPAVAADGKKKAQADKPATAAHVIQFRTPIPLGVDGYELDGVPIALLVAIEDAHFDGWQRVGEGGSAVLLDASGNPVRFYPESVRFRITASAREKLIGMSDPLPVAVSSDELLKGLRFRLKVFRALRYRHIQPESVSMIGVPANLDYPERIYRARFALGRLPIEDRVVLEVLAPGGQRIARFHLDLK